MNLKYNVDDKFKIYPDLKMDKEFDGVPVREELEQ